MMKKLCVFLGGLLLAGLQPLWAQTVRITGTVTGAEDGTPLPGVSVVVQGTSVGVATNIDGKYELNAPKDAAQLVFSYIGYETQTVDIAGRNQIDVALAPASEQIEEVMVVAYGTQKKASLTGSATAISSKKLEKRIVTNVTKALDGMASGVQLASSSGKPGDGASIIIRGFGSINASDGPLYVVDGAPFDGNMSSINSQDIESMTVLKDAASAALYGARAANGVIMITTKKAKGDKISINYNFNGGWQDRALPRYDLVDQRDFVNMTYEALRNDYVFDNGMPWEDARAQARLDLANSLGGELYNPFKNYTWATLIDPETDLVHADAKSAYDEDWMEEITHHNAFRQEHQLSLMGGTQRVHALMSLGYLNQDGILKESGFERYTGRANVDIQPTKWIKGGLNLSGSTTKSTGPSYSGSEHSNVWYSAQFMAPIYPVYLKDADGNNLLDDKGEKMFDYGANRVKLQNFNSVATLYDDYFESKSDNAGVRTFIALGSDSEDAAWAKGLKLTVNLHADYRGSSGTTYYNMYHGNAGPPVNGRLTKSASRMLSFTFNQLLTYDRKFNEHSINLLAGHEYYNWNRSYLTAQKTGLVDGIIELRPGTVLADGDSYSDNYRIESWLGRINYDYDNRYYFSASARTDGSSRFFKDSRWGVFWSVGANWNIKQEQFLQGVDWINNLALRVSYGVQGNDAVGLYAWQSFYALGYPNASNNGAIVSTLENKDVKWEKNENLNIGLDFRVLDNMIDLSVEYYRKHTKDMLLNYPMAMSTGFDGYSANVGNMLNQGVEFNLGVKPIDQENVQWTMRFIGSTTKNTVLKLTETEQLVLGNQVIEVDKPLYTFYMSKAAGVDPATGAQLYEVYDLAEGQEKVLWDGDTPVDPQGNPLHVYTTPDVSKAAKSKWYFGARMPKLYGSISTDLTLFKMVDLSVMTTYSIGGKVLDGLYRGAMTPMYTGDTWHKNALRRWRKPGDITDVPRSGINAKTSTSNWNLIDASYFAIKNITVGFTLPQKLTDKINAKTLRLYVALDNIATFTHMDGMDPQYNFTGGMGNTYTPNKTYSIGLNIGF